MPNATDVTLARQAAVVEKLLQPAYPDYVEAPMRKVLKESIAGGSSLVSLTFGHHQPRLWGKEGRLDLQRQGVVIHGPGDAVPVQGAGHRHCLPNAEPATLTRMIQHGTTEKSSHGQISRPSPMRLRACPEANLPLYWTRHEVELTLKHVPGSGERLLPAP
jgi:hypothetical protein